jgi:hypothetical protein
MEVVGQQLVGLRLFVVFQAIEFALFDYPEPPPQRRDEFDDVFIERLAAPLAEQSVVAVGAVVGAVAVKNAPAPAREKVERLVAAIPAIVGSAVREVVAMKQQAEKDREDLLRRVLRGGRLGIASRRARRRQGPARGSYSKRHGERSRGRQGVRPGTDPQPSPAATGRGMCFLRSADRRSEGKER